MTISVVIPVFHEEALINDAINRLKGMEPKSGIEIVVVDGSERAETLKVISSGKVKAVIAEKGRGRQMNRGVAETSGDIVLFLHVDTALPEGSFEDIAFAMESEACVGGAFDLGIADEGWAFRIIERVASLRSRLSRIPYGDQAIFVKRDYFLKMGGYKDLPLMEDVDLMRRVKKKGGRLCFINRKVKTSSRRWRKEGLLTCTLRNWTIMLLYLLGLPPERLKKWYA